MLEFVKAGNACGFFIRGRMLTIIVLYELISIFHEEWIQPQPASNPCDQGSPTLSFFQHYFIFNTICTYMPKMYHLKFLFFYQIYGFGKPSIGSLNYCSKFRSHITYFFKLISFYPRYDIITCMVKIL